MRVPNDPWDRTESRDILGQLWVTWAHDCGAKFGYVAGTGYHEGETPIEGLREMAQHALDCGRPARIESNIARLNRAIAD